MGFWKQWEERDITMQLGVGLYAKTMGRHGAIGPYSEEHILIASMVVERISRAQLNVVNYDLSD